MLDVVLIPARQEGPRVGAVVSAARARAPGAEVWVVDGDSTDATAANARAAGARVWAQEGQGYAAALRTGYAAALEAGVNRLVQLDADGQHPVAAVPRLLAALEWADVVVGSRDGTGSPGPWGRRAGNRALCAAASAAMRAAGAHDWAPRDATSGLQAWRGAALARALPALEDDVADANLRVLWGRLGLRVREVPVRMATRDQGDSMHDGWAGVGNAARSLAAVARAAHRRLP